MEVPEWIISSFGSTNLDNFLKEEFIEMTFDFEAKSTHLKELNITE